MKIAIYLVMVVLLFGLIALPITTSRMREIKIPEPPPYKNTTFHQNSTTANNMTTTDEYPIPRETEGVNDNSPIIYAFLISILFIASQIIRSRDTFR